MLLVGLWISQRLRHSRFGRGLRAISASEKRSRCPRHSRFRGSSLSPSSSPRFTPSAAGSLFAHTVGFISPEVFGPQMVMVTFTMLYVGGVGTLIGPVVGAIVASSAAGGPAQHRPLPGHRLRAGAADACSSTRPRDCPRSVSDCFVPRKDTGEA